MRNKRFEEWFADYASIDPSDVESMWTGTTYESHKYYVESTWAAWLAALGFTK
jgi:hypothetical protein